MYKPESVLKNETYKIVQDFEIQTDHLILARRPELILINKKKKKKEQAFWCILPYCANNPRRPIPLS